VIYALQNRFREAADEYYQALRNDAANDTSRISLVRALVVLGEFNDALPFIQDYIKRHSSDADGLTLRGTIYRGLGDYVKAEADLRRGVQIKSDDYDARYNLGFVLARLSKPQEALPHLEKARQLRPESTEARFQLASVLKTLKQDDRARIEFAAVGEQKNRSVQENVAGMKSNQAAFSSWGNR
jgi:tetratricopeptide (TPR) repeat protein